MLWGIYSAIYGEVNVLVEKCVEIKGDYVEKQQSCFISVVLKSWSGRKLFDPTYIILQDDTRFLQYQIRFYHFESVVMTGHHLGLACSNYVSHSVENQAS